MPIEPVKQPGIGAGILPILFPRFVLCESSITNTNAAVSGKFARMSSNFSRSLGLSFVSIWRALETSTRRRSARNGMVRQSARRLSRFNVSLSSRVVFISAICGSPRLALISANRT